MQHGVYLPEFAASSGPSPLDRAGTLRGKPEKNMLTHHAIGPVVGLTRMKQFWLSVIIPSHNGERWLAAALQSLVDQKEPGIEVIVIDGSSDDTSLKIVSSFSDKL